MSNGINSRQNEKNSIAMLAAQRQLYEDVGVIDKWNIVLSVILPLLLSFLQNIGVAWVKNLSYGLTLIMIFVSLKFTKCSKEMKEKASLIQLLFDVHVYQMPWDKKLFGTKKELGADIASKSKKILGDAEQEKSLHDWYTPSVDALPIEKGIITCQRENYHWDVGLRKRYRVISIIIIIVLLLLVLVPGIIAHETINELWPRAIFFIPMVRWISNTVSGLNEDINRLNKMDTHINSAGKMSMDELQEIQKHITDHRKACIKIPTVIYNKFKDNDEDKAARRVDFSLNDTTDT